MAGALPGCCSHLVGSFRCPLSRLIPCCLAQPLHASVLVFAVFASRLAGAHPRIIEFHLYPPGGRTFRLPAGHDLGTAICGWSIRNLASVWTKSASRRVMSIFCS